MCNRRLFNFLKNTKGMAVEIKPVIYFCTHKKSEINKINDVKGKLIIFAIQKQKYNVKGNLQRDYRKR